MNSEFESELYPYKEPHPPCSVMTNAISIIVSERLGDELDLKGKGFPETMRNLQDYSSLRIRRNIFKPGTQEADI